MDLCVNTNKTRAYILLTLCISMLTPLSIQAADDPLRLGIFPRQNPQTTIEMFSPLVKHLSQQLKREVKLEVSKDYEAFWEAVSAKQYDIVHYNQYHYIRSVKECGYQVILKNEEFGTDQLASALIIRKDSGISDLQDLKGKKLVFGGGPSAMVSYIMNTYLLQEAGLNKEDYTTEFSISPANAVYAAYYSHAAAAGAGDIVLSLPSIKKRIKAKEMKYLATSKAMPHIPWAVKGDMPRELRKQVQNILANLKKNKSGRSILAKAGLTGLNITRDSEYDEHRRIVKQVLGEDYCIRACDKQITEKQTANKFSPITIGIFPRRSQNLTNSMFQPMANYLSQKLGRKVQLITSKTFKEFWQGVKNKRYDVVHFNQFHYVKSHKLYGYKIIIKNEEFGDDTLTPAIYVRKDSGINNLQQLKGKKIIFGGGKMAMVSYIGNAYQLKKAGLKESDYNKIIAINPLEGCVAMFKGQSDACGAGTVLMQLPSVRKAMDFTQVKVLSKGKPFTHLSWAVKDSLNKKLQQQLTTILTTLHNHNKGKDILKKAKLTNLKLSNDEEYDEHRRLIREVTQEDYCLRNCEKTTEQVQKYFSSPPLLISIFPRREKRKTAQMFQPLANYLEEQLGRKVQLQTHKTYKSFWQGIKEKRYDLIHANQFQYVRSHKLHGYDVILKNEEFGLQTITPAIYVRKDSGINKLKDLKGKHVIFGGGKLAMISYVGNLQLLRDAGLKDTDYNWKFAVTPPNGCYAMFLGQADACGAAKVLLHLKSFSTKVDISKIKMLATNIPLAHVNWSVKKNMNSQLRNKIQNLLSDLHETENGKKILEQAGLTKLHKSNNTEYDVHRKIIYDVLGERY